MFIEFDHTIINAMAVSQFVMRQMDGQYKIIAFRIDGSYIGSEAFDTAEEANERYKSIKEILIF